MESASYLFDTTLLGIAKHSSFKTHNQSIRSKRVEILSRISENVRFSAERIKQIGFCYRAIYKADKEMDSIERRLLCDYCSNWLRDTTSREDLWFDLGDVLLLAIVLQISKENDALKRENLALKAALVVSSSQLIRRIAPRFDAINAIDDFGDISSATSGRPDDDLLCGGDEATALFYESRLQSYQQLLNCQAEARAKQVSSEQNFFHSVFCFAFAKFN